MFHDRETLTDPGDIVNAFASHFKVGYTSENNDEFEFNNFYFILYYSHY